MKIKKLYSYNKNKMEYVPSSKTYLKFTLGLILTFGAGMIYSHYKQSQHFNKIEYITEETRMLILNEENKFSEEKLKEYILSLNIKFPHIVLAQAKLESGNFESRMFRENNNFFGMKVARKRPTTNKGEQYGHACFDSWKDCVLDYAFYQAAYLHDIKTEQQYYEYLEANYAEDPNYINKLKNTIRK